MDDRHETASNADTLDDTRRFSYMFPNNIVSWDSEDDAGNPRNFAVSKKIKITLLTSLVTMGPSFASSSFSPTFRQVSTRFNISNEVSILSLSLFVLGFAFGPLVSRSYFLKCRIMADTVIFIVMGTALRALREENIDIASIFHLCNILDSCGYG